MNRAVVFLGLTPLLVACASNVYVPYPYPDDSAGVGRVIVKLTEPMQTVHVQIDGALVAEDEHTERVEIQNVPAGEREVQVTATEQWRARGINHTEVVTVEPNRDVTILLDTPPYGQGYWVFMAVMWLVAFSPGILIF